MSTWRAHTLCQGMHVIIKKWKIQILFLYQDSYEDPFQNLMGSIFYLYLNIILCMYFSVISSLAK